MAFNINDIKSTLEFGGARPTLFQCIITLPAIIAGDLSKLQFLARATQLPASNLGLIQVPYFGRKIKIAGDRTFDPWTVTIMNDEDFQLRSTLENWNYAINYYENNLAISSSPEDYKTDADVIQYGKDGSILRNYTFKGIFPETVSTIDLDWNNNDTIEEFQVQFQYDYFHVSGGSQPALQG